MRPLNLLLKFLLELAAFTALGFWGWYAGSSAHPAAGMVLAIAAPAVAIGLWARFAAPRASGRLPLRSRVPLELGVFAVAALGLAVAGHTGWALGFAVAVVVNAIGLTVFRQWEA